MTRQENKSLEQVRAQSAALADFGLFAFRCHDLDALLHRASELVSEALQVDLVKVLEHRPQRGDMLIRGGVGWAPGVVGRLALGDHAHSPGGFALQSGEPIVSRDVATETRFEIPEVLIRHDVRSMINVLIAGEQRPFGVLEVDARQPREFDTDDVACLRNYANLLAAAVDRIRAHRDLEASAREQTILAQELAHRVRNVLGLVQALASQTATADRTAPEYREVVLGRVRALAAAEDQVFENESGEVDLRRIAEQIMAPHQTDRPEAVAIEGGEVSLPARRGRMLGLALHELATNAAKHGALSVPSGRVKIEWRREDEPTPRIVLLWREADGPQVTPPERQGFGTRLLETIVGRELEGAAELDYHSTGLEYRLSFPAG